MAVINKLSINQFRNLKNQYIEPSKNINLFVADNAQGKTNLIEAIYYLGHNRSFKTKTISEVIHYKFSDFQLNAQIDNHRIKLEKSRNKNKIFIDQQRIKNTSQLTQLLPIQIITPDKGFVVNGTPKNKRSYLDWGVFHVELGFLKTFKSYNKILKNINVLLFNNKINELDFWFLELAKTAKIINKNRVEYIKQLKKTAKSKDLQQLLTSFDLIDTFDYQFYSGWPKEVDELDEQSIYRYLSKNIQSLLKANYLNYGPHKASINFSLNNKNECFLSRGEQKTLSIIFWLTQVLMLTNQGVNPVVLIDDISSELDRKKINTILQYLNALNVQTFMTDIGNHLPLVSHVDNTVFEINNGIIKSVN
ncbi:MAG TPA: DNA replication and repair protein RecF [Candidatus Thioglobus sp.]|jgi:DNA replication and repair protein RecF|nr:DNA replication and repair protein RecF [Candidatus Thioglobus sp.]